MMPDRDVTAVFIQGNTLRFYEKEGSRFVEKGETYFSDRPTLLAAIYSDSKDSYECNMMKSLKRLNALSGVMIKRTQALKQQASCSAAYYDSAIAHLRQLEAQTETPGISSLPNLAAIAESLNGVNEELNKMACPTIY